MTSGATTSPDTDSAWRGLARRMASQMVAAGDIQDPAWAAAFTAVPRHRLVPAIYQQDANGGWTQSSTDGTGGAGLEAVYAPSTLVTEVRDGVAVSSSTKPDLMARMLEMLRFRDGMRVLEIGTGTGYNAALLCQRLGEHHVFSLDVDAELVDIARQRLSDIGLRPHLAVRDGLVGWAEHAPYDRILATCSVPAIPWTWADQIVEGGLILADVKIGPGAGNLVLLRRQAHRLEGRFSTRWAGFMAMRPAHPAPTPRPRTPAAAPSRVRRTPAPAQPWSTHREAWMLATLHLPAGVVHGYTLDPETRQPTAARLSAADGSWCEVQLTPVDGHRTVREAGPTPLWARVEAALDAWRAAGQPGWDHYGLTVTQHSATLWLNEPGNTLATHTDNTWIPVSYPPL